MILGLIIPIDLFLLKIANDKIDYIIEIPFYIWIIVLIIFFGLLLHVDVAIYITKKLRGWKEKRKNKKE